MSGALWTVEAMAHGDGWRAQGALPDGVRGISIDTRTLRHGEAFFALRATFVTATSSSPSRIEGAVPLSRSSPPQVRRNAAARRSWSCRTCSMAWRRSAAPRARAQQGEVHRRHRLGRQDQHQGGAAPGAVALQARPTRRCASYNNHWGVPLSLARCRAERALRGVGNGHEPCGRDRAADPAGPAACRDRHHCRAGASRLLRLGRGDRRRQGGNLRRHRAGRRGGPSTATTRSTRGLTRGEGRGVSQHRFASASMAKAEARLVKSRCSRIPRRAVAILGDDVPTSGRARPPSGANSLAVLAAARLCRRRPRAGRAGARRTRPADRPRRARGSICRAAAPP